MASKKRKITKDTITVPFKTKFVGTNVSPKISNWQTTIIVVWRIILWPLVLTMICVLGKT